MKKQITIIVLLLTLVSFCQNVTYQSNNLPIYNPDRGFYHLIDTGTSTNYPLLSASQLTNYRNSENITTIQRIFYLNQFLTVPISSTYLTNMQTDFSTARNSGAKLIIRFAYSKDETAIIQQPTKALILSHISQLAPLLESNKDVISTIQLGFIGTWGEWYTTNNANEFGTGDYTLYTTLHYANRKEIVDACIFQFPQEIPLQLRYIYLKTKMYGNTYIGRIGFFNDAFLNVWGDQGTYLVSGINGTNPIQQGYLISQTANLPMTGETDGVNSPRTDCANAKFEMDRYNWSLLNKDYLAANITNWQTNGCYSEIDKNLGYRFELINSTLNAGILTINLHNIGYANVFKNRKAYIILKNITTNTEYSLGVEPFVENWITNQVTTLVKDLNNTQNMPNGTYKLYLNIPDLLNNNPKYSIQCANLGTWNSILGYNDLLQTFVYQKLSVNYFDGVIIVNNSDLPIKVYDLLGKLVSINKNISNLKKGIYIVVVDGKSFKISK
jgi:hypothetical protein